MLRIENEHLGSPIYPPKELLKNETLLRAYNATVNVAATGNRNGKYHRTFMTGVHIGDGLVLTNTHGLKGMTEAHLQVTDNRGQVRTVEQYEPSPDKDLMVCQLSKWSDLAHVEGDIDHQFRPHETLLVISYPQPNREAIFGYRGNYLDPNTLYGRTDIVDKFCFLARDDRVQYSGVYPGSSGSGIFTTAGDLAGIAYAYSRKFGNQIGHALKL